MKNSFVVKYATHLLLASLGIPGGFLGALVGFFTARILGRLLDDGIVVIDIQIDKLKQALKEEQWREAAAKAYEHASAKVYTDAEKEAIRQEYINALAKYATYGNGVPVDENSQR